MASVSQLRDDFADASISPAWTTVVSGSATAAETGGQAILTLPSSTAGTHIAFYRTAAAYDLTADSWYINIQTMVATGVAATATFEMFLDSVNKLTWRQLSGTLTARHTVAGVETQVYTVAWSAVTYKYLRITESGGNILWQSSTNGTSWTTRATVAVSSLFAVTALYIQFGASCGNIASPGSLRLDDVNLILPALSTNWNWTQVRWPVEVVHRNVTMAIDTVATGQAYVVTADGVDVSNNPTGTIRYFSGPASDGRLLTEQTTQAAAQAMAVNIPLDGRFDLPAMVQCRCVRVYHRSVDGSAYTIRELYPRRLVQADDIEAESIRAIHIAAGTITADKLSALLVVSNTISTAYNGARVTLSGAADGGFIGYGSTDTYDPITGTGTYQVLWSLADGKFYAGDGKVRLDTSGINIEVGNSSVSESEITWANPISAGFSVVLGATHDTGAGNASAYWIAEPQSGNDSVITINTNDSIGTLRAGLQIDGGAQLVRVTAGDFRVVSNDATIDGGLNIGTATGAATGQIKSSGIITAANVISSSGSSAGLQFADRTGANVWAWYGTGNVARLYTGTTDALQLGGSGTVNIMNGGAFQIASTQVVGARKTGYTNLMTGTANRATAYATGTITLIQLAERVKAMEDDLHSSAGHGLIGP